MAALLAAGTAVHAGGVDSIGSSRFTTIETRITLRQFPLDRVQESAADHRLHALAPGMVTFLPLDTGLWAGIPTSSIVNARSRYAGGELVDVRFSIGRPSVESPDPTIRAGWAAHAPSIDADALSRVLYGGTGGVLESTSLRQSGRASLPMPNTATTALSLPAARPASAALRVLPGDDGAMRLPVLLMPPPPPPRTHESIPEDCMEHPRYRRERLMSIAHARADGGIRPVR